MSVVGMVAEFNPLHTGHRLLLAEAKKRGAVVCALSGNFVQRGEPALAEKRVRAEAALLCGADLVLEIPVYWSMSAAQNYALGGLAALQAVGCEEIFFGSECGDIRLLRRACEILESPAFRTALSRYLETGKTFAAAREQAAAECGAAPGLLVGANDNLGIAYLQAAQTLDYAPEFTAVPRRGAGHDAAEPADGFVSASLLRERLTAGDTAFAGRYLAPESADLFLNGNWSDIRRIETAILALLRQKRPEELAELPDVSEGLHHKIFSAVKVALSLEELYNKVKVKRYTHARIRRLVLSAALGLDNAFFLKPPPYVRVLGFNRVGEALIKTGLSQTGRPVILRAGELAALSPAAQKVFDAECRATDLFALSLQRPLPCGLEYTAKLIKTEC